MVIQNTSDITSQSKRTPYPFEACTSFYYYCSAMLLDKIAKCLQKLPKNDFTRKMIAFDTYTKIE